MSTPVFEDVSADPRLARRRGIRKRLAEELVRAEKRRDLMSIAASIDTDSDEAADAHSATCQPLQAELDSIDQKRINDIVARRETSAKLINRQRELLAEINEANLALEMKVESNKRAKHKLNLQIREIEKEMTSNVAIENELCRFASPELRDRKFVLDQKIKFAAARKETAAGFVEKAQSMFADAERRGESENVRYFGEKKRQWQIELNDASESMVNVQREQAELRTEMTQPEQNELHE